MSDAPHLSGQQAFQSEVIESKEPVLVDFFAEWCGPCKMAAPIMNKLSQEYAGKAKVLKIDVDDPENRLIAQQFGIRSIPTVIAFSGGKAVKQNVGFIGEAGYRQMIDALL